MRALEHKLTLYSRIQLALAGTLAAGLLLFYLAAYRPTAGRLEALRIQIESTQSKLNLNQGTVSGMNQLVQAVEDLKSQVGLFGRRFPRQLELPGFVRGITQISQKLALEDWTYKPQTPKRGENFMELPIQMQFKGDFLKVASFLHELESLERETRIWSIAIDTKNGKPGSVSVDLTMSIYFSEG